MLFHPSYPFSIAQHNLNQLAQALSQLGKSYSQAVIISTPTVFALYGPQIQAQLNQIALPHTPLLVPEGETAKTMEQVLHCWKKMAALQIDRRSVVIALGGGVITDMAGFVAACYMRGIDYISIPTTLMAMVDAAIGGKTGVNFAHYKNLVGAFHSPQFILIDPCCLLTLSARERQAGLAEIIKYGIIASKGLFEDLERHMDALRDGDLSLLEKCVHHACQIKWEIVQQDPHDDKGIRAQLNYGHTFGHAIEALTQYTQYLHGEAVAIGMSCAAYLSYEMQWVERSIVERQDTLCLRAGLPIRLPPHLSIDQLIKHMKGDKKAVASKISLILLKEIGKVFTVPHMEESLIKQALTKRFVSP